MTDNFSRRTVLKGLAATPLLLAGCASQGGSSTPEGRLNIGQISNSVAFFPLFVADNQGFFEAEGVTIGDRPRLGTGAKLAAALKSGSVDVGAGVLTDAFNLSDANTDTRLVASLVTEYYVDITVSSSMRTPGANATAEEKAEALLGKKIGITGPGSGTEALVTYLLGTIGKDSATDVTLVNLGAQATSAVGALKAGRVDALSFFQPIGQIAEANGAGRIYLSPGAGDVPSMSGQLHGVMFCPADVADAKKDELAGVQRAIGKALEVVHGDEQKMRELLGEYLDSASPEVVDAMVPILRQEMPARPAIEREAYETGRKFHVDSGLVDSPPDFQSMTLA